MKKPVLDQRNSFKSINKHTFLEYVAEANMLTSKGGNYISQAMDSSTGQTPSPLELQLGFYVQAMTIPLLKADEGGASDTFFGKFIYIGRNINPDSNTIQMTLLNTKAPLIERIFYPWMRECTLPFWSYEDQPFTTATVTVDFAKHTDMKYVFYGCRPTQIQTFQPTQEVDTTITRDVTLAFDLMYIVSDKIETHESVMGKLLGSAASLAGGAMKLVNN